MANGILTALINVYWSYRDLKNEQRKAQEHSRSMKDLIEAIPTKKGEAPVAVAPLPQTEYAGTSQISAAGKACLPCGNDHFSTAAGLLEEALRFARRSGIADPEVITRIAGVEDELNAFERVDGASDKVAVLPRDEKALMHDMMDASRTLRHKLGAVSDVDSLEKVAAETKELRKDFKQRIFQFTLGNLSPEEKERVKKKAAELMERALGGQNG